MITLLSFSKVSVCLFLIFLIKLSAPLLPLYSTSFHFPIKKAKSSLNEIESLVTETTFSVLFPCPLQPTAKINIKIKTIFFINTLFNYRYKKSAKGWKAIISSRIYLNRHQVFFGSNSEFLFKSRNKMARSAVSDFQSDFVYVIGTRI